MIGLVVGGIGLLLAGLFLGRTTYALADRNLEMMFVVTDATTGEPIPNAEIELIAEEYKEKGIGQQVFKVVTDNEGRARFVHENNSCEDVIRPFRKTITLIDLTWAYVSVSAKGYSCTFAAFLNRRTLWERRWGNEGEGGSSYP